MAEKEPEEEKDLSKGVNSYAKFTSLAFQMIVIIGGLTWLGHWIDKSNNHQTPWATVSFALLGVFASLYTVFKSLKS